MKSNLASIQPLMSFSFSENLIENAISTVLTHRRTHTLKNLSIYGIGKKIFGIWNFIFDYICLLTCFAVKAVNFWSINFQTHLLAFTKSLDAKWSEHTILYPICFLLPSFSILIRSPFSELNTHCLHLKKSSIRVIYIRNINNNFYWILTIQFLQGFDEMTSPYSSYFGWNNL